MTNRNSGRHGRPSEISTRRIIRLAIGLDRPSSVLPDTTDDGLYVISVAARLLEMHPQTLRKYERVGLIRPTRTVGMLRLYSEEDIIRLRLIKHLVGDLGLNIAGVELALGMFNQMLKMRSLLNQNNSNDVNKYMEKCLDEMFSVLKVRPS